MLALFLFLERATGSTRAAGIGARSTPATRASSTSTPSSATSRSGFRLAAALLLLAVRWVDRKDLQLDARVAWGLAIGDGDARLEPHDHPPHDLLRDARLLLRLGRARGLDGRRGPRPSVPKPWRDPRGATAAIGSLLLRGPGPAGALIDRRRGLLVRLRRRRLHRQRARRGPHRLDRGAGQRGHRGIGDEDALPWQRPDQHRRRPAPSHRLDRPSARNDPTRPSPHLVRLR